MTTELRGKKVLVIGKGDLRDPSTARRISDAGGEVTSIEHPFQLLENEEKGAASLDKYDLIVVNPGPSGPSATENILLNKINRDLCIPVMSFNAGGALIRSCLS